MKIGLLDVDGRNFPNLALMKLSAWHKSQGDEVEFADPLFGRYDILYKSKVFTFTPDDHNFYNADKVIKSGTGYKDYSSILPDHIEHICPDYDLYPISEWNDGKTAYGFLTRGCIRRCSWCIVPQKEGAITAHADIDEFIAGKKKAVLLDNNVLASEWGLQQIEKIVDRKISVDFNQGLDARIIAGNTNIACLLSRVKWTRYIRMAYDNSSSHDDVFTAIESLRTYGIKPSKMFFYLLVTSDLEDAERRVLELDYVGAAPFAQPYRDFESNKEPPQSQKDFAHWVNKRSVFKSCNFRDFQPRKGFYCREHFK